MDGRVGGMRDGGVGDVLVKINISSVKKVAEKLISIACVFLCIA